MRLSSDVANLGFLLLVGILFFSPLLQEQAVFWGNALPARYFPERLTALNDFAAGTWPAWDPRFGLGRPADLNGSHLALFYPFNVSFFFLHPAAALNTARFIHQLLAPLFMYLMLRGIFVGPSGALVGALVFGLGGYPLARLWGGAVGELNALTYFPLVFLCGMRGLRGGWRYVGAGLLLMFLQRWDGTGAALVFQFLVLAAEALWVAGETRSLKPLAIFGIWAAAGLLLLAPFWLPAWYQTALGGAAAPPAGPVTGFHPLRLLAVVIPHLFGSLPDFTAWGDGPVGDYAIGLGVSVSFLAVLGARRTHRGLFFLALAILFALIAVGRYHLAAALTRFLPGEPATALAVVHFALAALAGIGWERLFWDDGPKRSRFALRVLLGLLLAALLVILLASFTAPVNAVTGARLTTAWLGWSLGAATFLALWAAVVFGVNRGRHWGEVVVLLLLLGELVFYQNRYLQMIPVDSYVPREAWKEWASWSETRWQGRLAVRADDPAADRYAVAVPALAGCWFADPVGSDTDPLLGYRSVRGILVPELAAGRRTVRVDLLATRDLGLRFIDTVSLARPRAWLPFAFVTGNVRVVPPSALTAELATVNVEEGEVLLTDAIETGAFRPGDEGDRLLHTGHADDEYAWSAHLRAPALLFVSMAWHPDWRALVDGKPQPVCRANGEFLAIPLDAGDHSVELRFAAPARKWGWVAFALGLFLTLSLVAGRRESLHLLCHTLPRNYQRLLIILLLAFWLLGGRWLLAAGELSADLAAPRLDRDGYLAAATSYHRRGMPLPAYHAVRLANRVGGDDEPGRE